MQADFRLARFDGAERNPEYVEMGSLVGVRNGLPIRSLVKIGTSGPKGEGRDGERGFTGLLDFTGQSGSLSGESDFSGWEFDFTRHRELSFSKPGQFSFQIATRTVGEAELSVTGEIKFPPGEVGLPRKAATLTREIEQAREPALAIAPFSLGTRGTDLHEGSNR